MAKIRKKIGVKTRRRTSKSKRKGSTKRKTPRARVRSSRMKTVTPVRTVETTVSIDRDLALAAIQKKKRGETPTAREVAALRRIEVEKASQDRDYHLRNCPKHVYLRMAGRQTKVVNEQALRYGLPLTGQTIDISAVVRAFHDFLAKNAQVFQAHHADATEDRMIARRMRQANLLQREAEAFAAAGLWISRSEADARRLEMVKWFRFAMNQASSELAVLLADERSVAKRRRIIATYFLNVRKNATAKGKGDSTARRRERNALGSKMK